VSLACRVDCLEFRSAIRQLEKLENIDWKSPTARNKVGKVAPNFGSFFEPLMSLMAVQETKLANKKKKEEKKASQSTVIASSASRPVTPNQPTKPPDPNYSGSSTTSQDELSTQKLVEQFIGSAMIVLGDEFTTIPWQQSGKPVMLFSAYHSSC
jgi:hypothetical protein